MLLSSEVPKFEFIFIKIKVSFSTESSLTHSALPQIDHSPRIVRTQALTAIIVKWFFQSANRSRWIMARNLAR